MLRQWKLAGSPHGLAVEDGTVYVGLADPQAVVAIDGHTGEVLRRVVLDSRDLASTKEMTTLRIDRPRHRLVIAQGRDESVTILALPDLGIVREITLEGEVIRDAIPDPDGRYLYVLGTKAVHVFDANGEREIRRIDDLEPTAIAASARGDLFAVVGLQDFGNATASVISLWSTADLRELAREPLQTEVRIETVLFGAHDRAIVFFAPGFVGEKPLDSRPPKQMHASTGGAMRMSFAFGDLVSSEMICLPDGAGPQIATPGPSSDIVFFAEKRCGVEGSFTASTRRVSTASVYGVHAYAIQYDASSKAIYATDPAGYLTVYKVPRVERR